MSASRSIALRAQAQLSVDEREKDTSRAAEWAVDPSGEAPPSRRAPSAAPPQAPPAPRLLKHGPAASPEPQAQAQPSRQRSGAGAVASADEAVAYPAPRSGQWAQRPEAPRATVSPRP